MKNKKKRVPPRTRDWSQKHETAFSHDLAKHRKAIRAVPSSVAASAPPPEQVRPNAIVVSHTGQWAFVLMDGQERLCLIDEALGDRESSLLVPGDNVQVEFHGDQPVVRGIGLRRTKLSRMAHIHSNLSEQVIAANIDVLVIVTSAVRPRFKPGVVDRYLIEAEVGGVQPLLVVNKMDIVDAEPRDVQQYRDIGLTVLNTSCVTGMGVDMVREALQGRSAVLAGQSGVGKSSLLNALSPSLDILTQEVSKTTEKGKHTTSRSRLYQIEGGIRIIDTPGVRQLGLWGVSPQDLTFYYPEIAEFAANCRFRNCTHTHEPGCAVQAAVDKNDIPRPRFASYLRIRESLTAEP